MVSPFWLSTRQYNAYLLLNKAGRMTKQQPCKLCVYFVSQNRMWFYIEFHSLWKRPSSPQNVHSAHTDIPVHVYILISFSYLYSYIDMKSNYTSVVDKWTDYINFFPCRSYFWNNHLRLRVISRSCTLLFH